MTILGGNYEPVKVKALDLVGYKGKGEFVILNPVREPYRKLPSPNIKELEAMPMCIRAKIENNQVINFGGIIATLNDVNGVWHFKPRGEERIQKLDPFTFFEIGECK